MAKNWLHRFRGNDRGSIAVMTALTLPVMALLLGGTLDYTRGLTARSKLQAKVDAALLATMTHMRQMDNPTQAQLKAYFMKELNYRLSGTRLSKLITITEEKLTLDDRNTMTAIVRARMKTAFLGSLTIENMQIAVKAQTKASQSATEVALVLDVTGSMGWRSCSGRTKLQELKDAVINFLDTVRRDLGTGAARNFRVAIVPFSQYVNVGTHNRNANWIDVPPDGMRTTPITREECTWNRVCDRWDNKTVVCLWDWRWRYSKWIRWQRQKVAECKSLSGSARFSCWNTYWNYYWSRCYEDTGDRTCTRYSWVRQCKTVVVGTNRRRVYWEGCVGSRSYPRNLRDNDYAVEKIPGVMNVQRDPRYPEMSYEGYTNTRNYCPSQPILPLQDLRNGYNTIKSVVQNLTADGWTYIPSGLAWGWRVLSPQAPFTQGASWDKNVHKVIVLMTDGANTVAPYMRNDRAYKDHGRTGTDDADRITRELCHKITRVNPTSGQPEVDIITITFDVKSTRIKNLLSDCSTLGTYDVKTGSLVSVFNQIAQKLVELHLSR